MNLIKLTVFMLKFVTITDTIASPMKGFSQFCSDYVHLDTVDFPCNVIQHIIMKGPNR